MDNNLGQAVLVKDINPNINSGYYSPYPGSSSVSNFTEFNDRLYFTANDGENGNELWITDGTSEGTNLLSDINPNNGSGNYFYAGSSYASNFIEFNDRLYFTANDGENGNELWVSDGTSEGTNLLIDINPSEENSGDGSYYTSYYYFPTDSSYASNFTEFNDRLYFTANDGVNGNELWVSDGTSEDTNLLIDINPGINDGYYSSYPNSSYANNFTEFNDRMYFTANDGVNGNELWVSDGTSEDTSLLIDINPGSDNSYYSSYPDGSYASNFIEFNDRLYFTANDGVNGNELWVSDGTSEGTNLLIDINPGSDNSYFGSYPDGSYTNNFIEFNDRLYFTANDGVNGNELWVSDGTSEGTNLLIDINPGSDNSYYGSYPDGSYIYNLVEFDGKLYFTANDGVNGNELWVSDGTSEGTYLLLDINPGSYDSYYGSYPKSSFAGDFVEFNDRLYFNANDGENGNELWVTDGTTEGTQLVADIYPGESNYGGAQGSYPFNFAVFEDELFFSANNGVNGRELFKLTLDDSTNYISGTNNPDRIVGGSGADRIEGFDGKDTLNGAAGDDILLGGDGKDRLLGGNDNDTLFGGDGKDSLLGGDGDDSLLGEDGKDTLSGGNGHDTLTGGDGSNVFAIDLGQGSDVITDFELGSDRLALGSDLEYDSLTFSGHTISFEDEVLATLDGVNTEHLTVDDFEN